MSKKFILFVLASMILLSALAFTGITSQHASAATEAATGHATSSVALACPPTLSYGSTGSWVKTLQKALNSDYNAGYFPNTPYNFKPLLKVDGNFGQLTQNAVKDFQEWYLLVVDGVVGPKTWHTLGYC